MLGKVFKAYDIRAKYPNPLNEGTAWKIGYGTARFLLEQAKEQGQTDPMMKHVLIGRDMRPSSPDLQESLCNGIRACGAHVIDLGLVDTPFVYFAINYLDCAGGVQVTASHNPVEYNGFKISGMRAVPIGQVSGLEDISKYAAMADQTKTMAQDSLVMGRFEERDLWNGYQDHVLSFLKLGSRKLKVVVDASNGMAGTMIPKVFADIKGLKIIPLNFDNTQGTFAHDPNPLVAANLEELRARVVSEKADFGICFDGDADRGIFVDEQGNILGCDHLTAMMASTALADHPGAAIVYDLRSSRAVREEVLSHGGKPIESRVGHVFMKEKLREHEAVLGGELSGHFYFRENFNTDSGAIAFATMASIVSASTKPLSALVAPLARYAQSGEINFETQEKEEAIEELEESYGDRGDISDLDGITVDCFESEGWWCNVRMSNTEPLLRLNLEAKNQQLCDRIVAEIAPCLGQRVDH
ncbi:MAG: phosphomannomutase/phosphoglucomutase [Planctomycetes bacterium]|nr:phosphomannomutase/phosphoglucomutase [Planctomycetota bacterium]NOG55909.1 phosphomannomutase/phosphoglucomutase [Planctomycetota bacterium]